MRTFREWGKRKSRWKEKEKLFKFLLLFFSVESSSGLRQGRRLATEVSPYYFQREKRVIREVFSLAEQFSKKKKCTTITWRQRQLIYQTSTRKNSVPTTYYKIYFPNIRCLSTVLLIFYVFLPGGIFSLCCYLFFPHQFCLKASILSVSGAWIEKKTVAYAHGRLMPPQNWYLSGCKEMNWLPVLASRYYGITAHSASIEGQFCRIYFGCIAC